MEFILEYILRALIFILRPDIGSTKALISRFEVKLIFACDTIESLNTSQLLSTALSKKSIRGIPNANSNPGDIIPFILRCPKSFGSISKPGNDIPRCSWYVICAERNIIRNRAEKSRISLPSIVLRLLGSMVVTVNVTLSLNLVSTTMVFLSFILNFGFMCLPLPTKTSTCKWSVFSPCFISVVSAAINKVWSIDFGLKVLRARAANFWFTAFRYLDLL